MTFWYEREKELGTNVVLEAGEMNDMALAPIHRRNAPRGEQDGPIALFQAADKGCQGSRLRLRTLVTICQCINERFQIIEDEQGASVRALLQNGVL